MRKSDNDISRYYKLNEYFKLYDEYKKEKLLIIYGPYWRDHPQGLNLLNKAKRCLKKDGFHKVYLVQDLNPEDLELEERILVNAKKYNCDYEVNDTNSTICAEYFAVKSKKSLHKANIKLIFIPFALVEKDPSYGTIIELAWLYDSLYEIESNPQIDLRSVILFSDSRALVKLKGNMLLGIIIHLEHRGAQHHQILNDEIYGSKAKLCPFVIKAVNNVIHNMIIRKLYTSRFRSL